MSEKRLLCVVGEFNGKTKPTLCDGMCGGWIAKSKTNWWVSGKYNFGEVYRPQVNENKRSCGNCTFCKGVWLNKLRRTEQWVENHDTLAPLIIVPICLLILFGILCGLYAVECVFNPSLTGDFSKLGQALNRFVRIIPVR